MADTTRLPASLRALFALVAIAGISGLAACGGGGSGSGATGGTPAPPPSSGTAVLSVALAGGASPGTDHLWVTVTGFAMNTDATKVYGDGDPGWVVQTLAAPVTLDLADPSLSQGQSLSLLKQNVTTLGTFAQLRLLVAPSDPGLVLDPSASAAGLQFNDQVQYTDANGVHIVPLEVPDLQAGLRLLSPFTLSADSTTPLSIEWNAHASLVRRASTSGSDRFTVRDELQLYNQQLLTALGDGSLQIGGSIFDSISGQLDTTQFCAGASQAGCIHDVVASATSISADGRFHEEVRSVDVSASGSFVLYPLPTESLYDVVIHGGNMQTIVVRDVFVDPTGILKPTPTALSSAATPIVPVLDTTERSVTVSNALSPAGSRVLFGQTVPGSGGGTGGADIPYVIAYDAADPLTGTVLHTITLPGGPLHDALFDPSTEGVGVPPPFTTVTPSEGLAAWSVWSLGRLSDATSAIAPLAATATSVVAPNPVRLSAFSDGTLTVTVSGTASNGADHAELIVSNDGGTVSVVDASALIGSHGGSVPITLPAGQSSTAPAATVYGIALRTWAAASETATTRWARAGVPVSLSAATTGSVALAFP